MDFPSRRDYAEHSRFALIRPGEYVRHVDQALRNGKGPQEGNYFEDLYNRARHRLLEMEHRHTGTGINMRNLGH